MPISLNRVAATVAVGFVLFGVAKIATSAIYPGSKDQPVNSEKQEHKTARKVLIAVSIVFGIAAAAYFANYKGWISLASLAPRFSFNNSASSATTISEQSALASDVVKKLSKESSESMNKFSKSFSSSFLEYLHQFGL